jgi:thiol-disulfide isomerase/thioredoxin
MTPTNRLEETMIKTALLCAALVAALPNPSPAAPQAPKAEAKAPTLTVGDAAPALSIEKWVKGSPVAGFEKGKTYVVEFWATWCGPCIAGMPHLSEIQKKYGDKGLTVVGVSCVDSRGNTLDAVEKMVKDKGDKMAYTVAWDTERKTNEAYMKAAQQGGIPCAFLVDGNGKIAYIGHPMRIDDTLEKVVAGKHDLKALAEAYKKTKENEAKAAEVNGQLNAAMQAQDWEGALKAADDLIALDPEQFAGVAPFKFQVLATNIKDMARANAWAKQASEGVVKDNAEALNGLAWQMVDPETQLEGRDVDLALKIATRANEVAKEKNPGVLDTLARAWFTKGDVAKAVEFQRKAVALDGRLKGALKEYEDALAKRG